MPDAIDISLAISTGLALFSLNLLFCERWKLTVLRTKPMRVVMGYAILSFFVCGVTYLLSSFSSIAKIILLLYGAALCLPGLPNYVERKEGGVILWRVMRGSIDRDERFLDIIISDFLTSYARVFGDIALLFSSSPVLLGLFISIPYWIRFRQCCILYHYDGTRGHLFNAFKYATALPVIILGITISSHQGLWIVSCLVNSGYSLYWDIAQDWDLDLRTSQVRPQKLFPVMTYYLASAVDALLRFVWVVRVIPLIAKQLPISVSTALDGLEISTHGLEYIELLRRWIWVFLRVEAEHFRHQVINLGGFTLPDTVEMEDYIEPLPKTAGRRASQKSED